LKENENSVSYIIHQIFLSNTTSLIKALILLIFAISSTGMKERRHLVDHIWVIKTKFYFSIEIREKRYPEDHKAEE